ncbi:MobV family relaxase [Acinetobacter kyonggiensis]|uniref:Plasmid recombination enzyme n=1 Tax=Acinetobacter kyonggiensis TaxID=595670 RepID=A0A1H3NQI8_9GAMM|nr:MobV family relaxase [Acinetobacter kyonggiensis]SDY91068.1 Plasmid recombination enzyme [Acinetobacter kyonggiensis]
MSFAIYRTAKLGSFGEIGGSLSHTYRTRPTPNADENKLHLNKHIFETYNQCFDALKNAIPEKRRSNAVLCIEHLITASPDWNGWGTKKEEEFFKKSLEFLNKKYGKENVIACSIHRDETTPHLIVYVVPIDEKGGLNAKKWLGGRSKLSQTQTEFANEVKHLGLERGLENSKARHKTIKEFYAEIEKPTPKLEERKYEIQPINYDLIPKMGLLETTSSFNKKLEASYKDIHFNYENQMLRLKEEHHEKLKETVNSYEKKLVENGFKLERLSNENQRLKSDKKLIREGFEKKIELLEKEKKEITNDKLMSLREFGNFSELKKVDFQAYRHLKEKAFDVVHEHKLTKEAERSAQLERQHRERERLEMEHRAALQKKVDQHSAWVSQLAIERKEGVFAHDLKVVSANSENQSEKAAIAELLQFRKFPKPTLEVKGFKSYLAELEQGDLSRLPQLKKAIEWSTSNGLLQTISNLEMTVDWNDRNVEKVVFYAFENISQVIEKELEKTKYSEVEKIKKLADFGDFVREKTDLLYSDYLQTRLKPLYEREEQRKEHLEAMRKIDPNYMRGISLNNESEPEKPKPKQSRGNDFSM